jgi:hypothetical protein
MHGSVLNNLRLLAGIVGYEIMQGTLRYCRLGLIETSRFVHIVPHHYVSLIPYVIFRVLGTLGD